MTPTLAGTTIVLGDARLTADEARTLARNLHRAADEAEGAVRTLRADEARAQREGPAKLPAWRGSLGSENG